MTHIHRIKAEVKVNFEYFCNVCGASAVGDTHRCTVEAGSAESLAESIKQIQASSHDMPVGWGCYGHNTFRCPKCKDHA